MTTPPTSPTILPPKLSQQQLFFARLGGYALIGAALFVSYRWGATVWGVNVVAAGVCTAVGKYLGIPVDSVIRYVLASQPEKALSIAAEALKSLPPERAEVATRELLASLPPQAQARVGVVLLNTTEPPPAPET